MPLVERTSQQVNLQRAVVIGLGGTGAEVICRLRKLVLERFGSFEALPLVRFLYIDTDPNWIQRVTSKVEADVRLSSAEVVDAQVHDASGLYEGIAKGNYPNYGWFTYEKLKSFANVEVGAGTIRQLGRMCFWLHQDEIREKLSAAIRSLNDVRNADYMQAQYGITVDPGINVHVIAGLAGGTGSGTFLDMAYLARRVVDTAGIAGGQQHAGYLVLPGAYADLSGTNALPNGYAALKELNYLSYRPGPNNPLGSLYGAPEWTADYGTDGDRLVQYKNQAPFDFCYLLDSANSEVQLRRTDIYAMLARSLFHEFTLEFACFKRSLRANIRNRIVSNDPLDCPAQFMSFGQSAVYLPAREIKSQLTHQLALKAMQKWIDDVDRLDAEAGAEDGGVEQVVQSMVSKAAAPEVLGAVKAHIISEFVPGNGFKADDMLLSVVSDNRMRLADIPYNLREQEKEQYIRENWTRDMFEGRLTGAWSQWRRDFSDEGPSETAWGERIRWMVANREKAFKLYLGRLHDHALSLFQDSARGPAWALAFVDQAGGLLQALKTRFINEANDAALIANQMGDLYVINAASSGKGPSLTQLLEAKIGDELRELDEVARENWAVYLFGGEDRLRSQAYSYLTYCAHWCRARVEERGRRLASEMCGRLIDSLADIDRELRQAATVLAQTGAQLSELAAEWRQKAATTENVGKLLYDQMVVDAVERGVKSMRGDAYDPGAVGSAALKSLGVSLSDIARVDPEKLKSALLDAAASVIGELTEDNLTETCCASYDILSALCVDQNELENTLRATIDKGAPFVKLLDHPTGGRWRPDGGFPQGLLETRGVGIRGGYRENDQDTERVRVMKALDRIGWSPQGEVRSIADSEQVLFVQECGGFPLRALSGITEMRDAYLSLAGSQQATPLHIVRDEMAVKFPDILPPSEVDLQRALTVQSIGVGLGFIAPAKFMAEGAKEPVTQYAFMQEVPGMPDPRPVALGDTPAAVGMKLAYSPELCQTVLDSIATKIDAAAPEARQEITTKLRAYMTERRAKIAEEYPGVDPSAVSAYTQEEDRVSALMVAHGLC